MKRIFTLIVLCMTLQVGNAQIHSSYITKRAKARTTKKTTTKKRSQQPTLIEPSTSQRSKMGLNSYEVSEFFNLNNYGDEDIVRLLSGYEWVVKGKSQIQREFFPEEISYRTYPSHPNYRLYGHSLFDNQGELKVVLFIQYSYGNDIIYDEEETGMTATLLKCIMAKAYKNNAYNVNLAPNDVRKEIESQLLSGESVLSYDENVQKATRYCEQLREDCAKQIANVKRITRVDARTFKVQFADEDDASTYSATIKFRSNGAYKVTYDITLPEGLTAYLLEIGGNINSDDDDFSLPNDIEEDEPKAKDEGRVYEIVEEQPKFPGGQGALMSWISSHLEYPKVAQDNGVSGKVIVQFVVGTDGSISNAKVTRSVDQSLDMEAIRVVKSMPRWTPGKQDGKPVPVRYTMPVVFRLN